ncbi:DUF3280 domain-containing protein [Roseibium salinum]|uniref:DUF3280 domain-containing protein n=1 Tax=Roseibium salinum TaxID=1604349 RepID=A0ABT3R491_9HYPH|nr:DUF3280 domain-containing protein [Roseibium sp. DSM 29163]MCX2723989.1 DUF3280 domain-containing protein [Roseibium sp. DSM 29163]
MSLWLVIAPMTANGGSYKPLEPGPDLAYLGFSFVDLSTEGAYNGVRADETGRLRMLEETLRERFAQEGYTVLSNDPIAAKLATVSNPARCYDCEIRLADRLGARYVVVGEVRKVSNLVLSISLVMRDVETGDRVRALAVDIRGNTDQSWLRGMDYILKNHFFKQ